MCVEKPAISTMPQHRIRSTARAASAVAGVILASAMGSPSASAAVRTATVPDPKGDSSALQGPALDIESFGVRYDDAAGALRMVWTYYDDLRSPYDPAVYPAGQAEVYDAPNVPGQLYDKAGVNWFARRDDQGTWLVETALRLSGASGSLSSTGTLSDDGRVVTAEFALSAMTGGDRAARCRAVTRRPTSGSTASPRPLPPRLPRRPQRRRDRPRPLRAPAAHRG
jgi:hypothetical protein